MRKILERLIVFFLFVLFVTGCTNAITITPEENTSIVKSYFPSLKY